MKLRHESNAPYFLKNPESSENSRTVVLIHGLSGSPHSVKGIAEVYRSMGFQVFAPLLSGHGTDYRDLKEVQLGQWRGDVDRVIEEALSCSSEIFLCGFSLGGALVLDYLMLNPGMMQKLGHILLVAPFFGLYRPWLEMSSTLLNFLPIYSHSDAPIRNHAYSRISVHAVAEALQVVRKVRRGWIGDDAPLLGVPVGIVITESDLTISNQPVWSFVEEQQIPRERVVVAEKKMGLLHRDLASHEIFETGQVNPILSKLETLVRDLSS